MRLQILVTTLALSSGIAAGTVLVPAFAQTDHTTNASGATGDAPVLTLHEVQLKLDAMGYRDITKISRKHETLLIKATDPQGRRVDIDVDPASGAIVHSEIRRRTWDGVANANDQASWLTLHQVQVKLEALGYRNIQEIDREPNGYEVKAADAQGQPVKLAVAPRSGEVVESRKLRDHK